MASEGSADSRYSLPLLLALIGAGLAGNYFKFPFLLNIDFLFGSIFAMLALQFFGLGRGLLAALFISSYTYLLWNHPYAIVTMTAEMAVVGWLVTRRKMGLVLADTLYWVCLGVPLVYLFYRGVMHLSPSNVHITMVKQAVNGIANALAARLLFTGHSLRSRTFSFSFRELLYNLMASFLLFPALILVMVSGRSDFAETDRTIRSSLLRDSHRVANDLEHWIEERKAVSVNLAGLAATLPLQQMQSRLEQAKASDPSFLRIGLHDRDATTIAYTPLTDESGKSTIGKSYADRPFLPALRRDLKPLLSEIALGRVDPTPRVLMLVPVLSRGSYAGYLAGTLNLDHVRDILKGSRDSQSMLYTLLDKNGNVIITNRKDQKIMTPFVRGPGELKHLEDGISTWRPILPPGTPNSERWKRSLYLTKNSVGSFGEWSLVLEQPVEPFQVVLFDRYAKQLALLFMILIGALAVAELLSRRMDASLQELRAITSDLPARLAQGLRTTWPESPVLEVQYLVRNFGEMTASLKALFLEISALNDTLELRVEERTQELSSLNRDFVNFLENTSDFIYFKDENSRFRFCSQTLANITGHPSWRDMIGKHALEVFPEETARCYCDEELPIFRDGSSLLNKVNPYYDAQGGRGWVSTNKWPVFDADRKVVGLFGISRDISAMVQIQESLQLARQSLDQVPDCIIWADLDGQIVDCNEGACQSLGYSQQELLGESIFVIDPIVNHENWQEFSAQMRTQRVMHFESSFLTREGRAIPMDIQVTHIAFDDKDFFCGVGRDISARKLMEEERLRLERRMLHLQKLESLGVLSGGIAHDFNNLLQVVLGNLDLSLMMMPDEAAVRKNLEQAVIATVRASELSGLMLAYSGKGLLAIMELNLNDLLRENVTMLRAVTSESVSFISRFDQVQPPVQADAGQVLQVVMSLVRNASEAIGEGAGSITLATGVEEFDQTSLNASRLEEKLPPGSYVWIEVNDTGCGMDEATQYKIFDPFFTTKFTGRGLGMSAALGIMRAHKGAIMLESSLGVGTTVRLLFPVAPDSQPTRPPRPELVRDSAAPTGDKRDTILIVDDEEMIRTLSVAMLQAFGFDVLVAADGEEALAIFRKEGNGISLVLLDQSMPIMDGLTVFKEMRLIRPEIKVLLASGYSEKEVSARFQGLDLNGFIQKPFNVQRLSDEVRRVLKQSDPDCPGQSRDS